jgi:hypothetical protein
VKIEEFIDIYRYAGQEIKTFQGSYFKTYGTRSYSYPLNYKITISKNLITSLSWKYLISVIFTDSVRKNAIEFILNTTDYSLDRFGRKIRNRISKSLKSCTFKRPELDDLLKFGLLINRQTLRLQHRKDKTLSSQKIWCKYITTLYSEPDFIILGAYFQDRMVGYVVALELEGSYNMLHANIDRQDSETTSPMCGLIYTLVNQIIEKEGSICLSYGLDQFTHIGELSRFKRNMLFKQIPVSRVYIINPMLLLLFSTIIFIIIQVFKLKNVRNHFLRSVIYLYQGNRLLTRNRGIANHT